MVKNILTTLFFFGFSMSLHAMGSLESKAADSPAAPPTTTITEGIAGLHIGPDVLPDDISEKSFMRVLFGGEQACRHIEAIQCFKSGSPIAELNRVWTPNETVSYSQLKEIVNHMGYTQYCWWVHRSQKALAKKLTDAWFTVQTETETLMMTNLADNKEIDAEDRPGISITKHDRYCHIVDLAADGFNTQPGYFGFFFKHIDTTYPAENIAFYRATYKLFRDGSEDMFVQAASCVVIMHPTTKTVSLHVVSTIPASRNRGLATALSKFALRDARSRGYTKAILLAPSRALSLYKKLGFIAVGGENAYSVYKSPNCSRCTIL